MDMNTKIKIWRAKKLLRKIDKYQNTRDKFRINIKTLDRWIRRDKNSFKRIIKSMDSDELELYGVEQGYYEN